MKKFKFSMQGVLNVRTSEFEAKKLDLARARARLREEEDRLAEIGSEIERTLTAPSPDTTSTYYFVQRERYLRMLKDKKKKQAQKVRLAEAEVDKCMRLLGLARMELKKMEKALEHEKKKWSLDYYREEQKIIDETATSRAFFGARGAAL